MRHAAVAALLLTMTTAASACPVRVLMLGEVHDNAADMLRASN